MAAVYNRVGVAGTTTGTGTVTLGSAITDSANGNLQTFAAAGAPTGAVVSYLITDGAAWELGTGTYTAATPSLTRTLVSSSTGALLSLSGSAKVYSTPFSTDIVQKDNCCRFQYTSTTVCTLVPFGGNTLIIGNAVAIIPSAGVTISNSGMAASTLYYIYAWLNAGVLTLEYSTTANTTDSATGRVVKTGDTSRRLVGAVRTDSNSLFLNSSQYPLVRSFLNDPGVGVQYSYNSAEAIASTTVIGFSSYVQPLTWAGEQYTVTFQAVVGCPAGGITCSNYIYLNGSNISIQGYWYSYSSGYGSVFTTVSGVLPTGTQQSSFQQFAQTSDSTNTVTWYAGYKMMTVNLFGSGQ